MKKITLFWLLAAVSVAVFGTGKAVSLPDVGNARLHIVGQNAMNYLTNFDASNTSCADQEEFNAKTAQMASVFLSLQADIVALCEVQEDDDILGLLAAEMNSQFGQNVFTHITDGMYASASYGKYQAIKCGFIYRTDKLELHGSSSSPYSSFPYKARLRIQAFKETSTGEVFTLSLNHFKAKDSSEDQGESTRLENVEYLLNKLSYINYDPDILIMGDLNAYMNEAPIEALEEAGYEEQLVRFDPNAYSYIYKGKKGLLDHAMANEPMAAQIIGAGVYHFNTSNYNSRFSDHDTYVVGVNLGQEESTAVEEVQGTVAPCSKVLHNGKLYILYNGTIYDVQGRRVSQ